MTSEYQQLQNADCISRLKSTTTGCVVVCVCLQKKHLSCGVDVDLSASAAQTCVNVHKIVITGRERFAHGERSRRNAPLRRPAATMNGEVQRHVTKVKRARLYTRYALLLSRCMTTNTYAHTPISWSLHCCACITAEFIAGPTTARDR